MAYKYNSFTNNLDEVLSPSGSGVDGPGSSTDNAIVRWNGTGGDTIKNSSALLDDSGDLTVNSVSVTVPLTVSNGGTGASSLSDGFVLLGSGTGAITALDVSAKGSILVGDGTTDPTTLPVGIDTYVLTANSSTASGLEWAAGGGGGSSPLTTKGDLYTYSSADARLGIGTDEHCLIADSAQTTGNKWGVLQELGGGTGQSSYTTGDILYSDSSNSLSKLAVPTMPWPMGNNASIPVWFQPNKYTFIHEDFIKGTKEAQIGRLVEASGGGSDMNLNDNAVAGHPGNIYLKTSGNSAAKVTWILGGTSADPTDDGSIRLGGGVWHFEWCFKPDSLSDGTDTYTLYAGLNDRIPGGSPVDSLYFSYTHGTNSGNWVITAANASSATSANTSTAAAADWTRLTLVVNAAATSANFYVNGSEVANSPIATNLPTTNTVAPFISIIRSAGTGSQNLLFDYFSYSHILTTAR